MMRLTASDAGSSIRHQLRIWIAFALRWRIREARRMLADRLARTRFADRRANTAGFAWRICR